MQVAALEILLQLSGGAATIAGLTQANTALNSLQNNARQASGGFRDMGGGLRSAVYSLQAMAFGAKEVGAALNAVTGIGIAAQYEGVRLQIEGITGNAQSATQALAAFQQIGTSTKYDTLEVAKYGQQFLNLGDSVSVAGSNMRKTLDLAGAAGLQRGDFNRFMTNLGQIRSGGVTGIADMRQMLSAAPGMGRILGTEMGLGRNATAKDMISSYRSQGPQGFFDMMMRASQQPGVAGAAGRMGPIDAFANMMESITLIMKPTGDILIALLTPLVGIVQKLGTGLGAINQATGGGAGLSLLFMGIARSMPLLKGGLEMAQIRVMNLRRELLLLSRTPGIGYPGHIVGGGGARFGPPLPGGMVGARMRVAGAAASARGLLTAGGLRTAALAGGSKLLGLVGGPAGIALMAATTLLPMAYNYFTSKAPGDAKPGDMAATQREIAQNTRATADGVKQMSGTGIGGGGRSKRVTSDMEVQRAVARMMATGLA